MGIEFKRLENGVCTLTKTEGSKTGTITITDVNGNGVSGKDKFIISGDASVFTAEELKGKFAEQNFYTVDKDSSTFTAMGDKITSGKEYSVESLFKSVNKVKTSEAKVTTSPVTYSAPTETVNTMQAISSVATPVIASSCVSAALSGNASDIWQYANNLNQFVSAIYSALNTTAQKISEPAKAKQPSAPAASTLAFNVETAPSATPAPEVGQEPPKSGSEGVGKAQTTEIDPVKTDNEEAVEAKTEVQTKYGKGMEIKDQAAETTAQTGQTTPENEALAAKKRTRINETITTLGGFLCLYEKNSKAKYGFVTVREQINTIRDALDKTCAELDALHVQNPEDFTAKLTTVRARLVNVPTEAEYKNQVAADKAEYKKQLADQDAAEKAKWDSIKSRAISVGLSNLPGESFEHFTAKVEALEAAKKAELTAIISPIDAFLKGSYKDPQVAINYDIKKKDDEETKVIELIDAMDSVLDGKMGVDRTWMPDRTKVLDKYFRELATMEFECSPKLKSRLDAFKSKLTTKRGDKPEVQQAAQTSHPSMRVAAAAKAAAQTATQAVTPAVVQPKTATPAQAPAVKKPPLTKETRALLVGTYSVQLKELGIKIENIISEKVGQEALQQAKTQAAKDAKKAVPVAKVEAPVAQKPAPAAKPVMQEQPAKAAVAVPATDAAKTQADAEAKATAAKEAEAKAADEASKAAAKAEADAEAQAQIEAAAKAEAAQAKIEAAKIAADKVTAAKEAASVTPKMDIIKDETKTQLTKLVKDLGLDSNIIDAAKTEQEAQEVIKAILAKPLTNATKYALSKCSADELAAVNINPNRITTEVAGKAALKKVAEYRANSKKSATPDQFNAGTDAIRDAIK